MADPVWFWQRIVSPHMAGLAVSLATSGRAVTYVAEQSMSADRAALGWKAPALDALTLRFAPDAAAATRLVATAPSGSIHICQGFRGNGVVGPARTALDKRGLRQWVVMETVEENGWVSTMLKRLEYSRLVRVWRDRIEGVLAIGDSAPAWLIARGMPAERVVPFAYFLSEDVALTPQRPADAPFRFLFIGQCIERKRIDLLIDALARLPELPFELFFVGAGPLETDLRRMAMASLGDRANWLGLRQIDEIPGIMADADCLVLPSRHDGWGAVVSEALMAGTPAICSDRCGAAGVVKASGQGGVFKSGNVDALAQLLGATIAQGRQSRQGRDALREWALCLAAPRGAEYLAAILDRPADAIGRLAPPWMR